MWRFIFSLVLAVWSLVTKAQEPELPILFDEGPAFSFRYVQVNYNALRLVQNVVKGPKKSQELQVELGIHKKYALVGDYGFANTVRGETYTYNNEGNFWRTGINVNMSSDKESGNFIGVGWRYARARFEDKIAYNLSAQDRNSETLIQNVNFENPKLTSEWMEFVVTMRVKIQKQFYTGYTLRYQFYNQLKYDREELKPFDIPGYGKTTKPNSFGFDYYVGWRLDFK